MITGELLVIEQVLAPDGSVHERLYSAFLHDGEVAVYHWSDGNMECDCNRASICGHADVACNGGEPTYKLNLLRADTRDVLYREF